MLITLLFLCTVVDCLLFDRIADIFKHPVDHVQRGFFHIVCQVLRICARIGNELEFNNFCAAFSEYQQVTLLLAFSSVLWYTSVMDRVP